MLASMPEAYLTCRPQDNDNRNFRLGNFSAQYVLSGLEENEDKN